MAQITVAASLRTIVVASDDGRYSGSSEIGLILQAFDVHPPPRQLALRTCAGVTEGFVAGQPVTAVVTGINAIAMASCMPLVLTLYDEADVREAILLGTGGWTPRRGGLLDVWQGCQAPVEAVARWHASAAERVNVIGDVCVFSATTRQDCGYLVPGTSAVDACTAPRQFGHDDAAVFGTCSFGATTESGSDAAVRALVRAAEADSKIAAWPRRPAALDGPLQSYWRHTWRGLNSSAPPLRENAHVAPVGSCAEVSSTLIWTGIGNDRLCRHYLQELLSTPSDEVSCVSAMEAPAFFETVRAFYPRVPTIGVRALSNYDFEPLQLGEHGWEVDLGWIAAGERESFTRESYRFAVQTSSRVVLARLRGSPPRIMRL